MRKLKSPRPKRSKGNFTSSAANAASIMSLPISIIALVSNGLPGWMSVQIPIWPFLLTLILGAGYQLFKHGR
jgi:hypothetical protein